MTVTRVLPVGERAVLIELGGEASVANARRAQALARAIERRRGDAVPLGRPVPAAASVLVPFDPDRLTLAEAAALLEPLLAVPPGLAGAEAGPRAEHRIPVRYGGDDGPDLERVAAETGRSPEEVVAIHAGVAYEVLFLGFAPGFAYLGEVPRPLRVPRLATPRTRVPAGSVAIAGAMTAVYPHASPGGWRLLGRTDAPLFDPAASPPALLRPGDSVRFEPA